MGCNRVDAIAFTENWLHFQEPLKQQELHPPFFVLQIFHSNPDTFFKFLLMYPFISRDTNVHNYTFVLLLAHYYIIIIIIITIIVLIIIVIIIIITMKNCYFYER